MQSPNLKNFVETWNERLWFWRIKPKQRLEKRTKKWIWHLVHLFCSWMPILSVIFDHLFTNSYNNMGGSSKTAVDIVWVIMQIYLQIEIFLNKYIWRKKYFNKNSQVYNLRSHSLVQISVIRVHEIALLSVLKSVQYWNKDFILSQCCDAT